MANVMPIPYYTEGEGPTCLDCKSHKGKSDCLFHGYPVTDSEMKRCDAFSSLHDEIDPGACSEVPKS